jgi:hypothetical protein
MKCTFLQIFKLFKMNNRLQKSSAPFRPFFGIFKENSAANFSGRTNFCRAPFEFCGRNFGPLATLIHTHSSALVIRRVESKFRDKKFLTFAKFRRNSFIPKFSKPKPFGEYPQNFVKV